jgi:hypothetical protein
LSPAGVGPTTFGSGVNKSENITTLESISYNHQQQNLTVNLSENLVKIQQDLVKIINLWPSLPEHIKQVILILINKI